MGFLAARRLAWVAFVGLMLLITVEAPGTSLRIVWRFAVLSFDSPATQLADELACESAATSQTKEADRYTGLVIQPSGRLAQTPAAPHRGRVALSSGITRSPPSA